MSDSVELYTIEDLARLLNTSKASIYNMRSRGTLPGALKVGKRAYFRKDIVNEWLRKLPTTQITAG